MELLRRGDEARALRAEADDAAHALVAARAVLPELPALDAEGARLRAALLLEQRRAQELSAALESPENQSRCAASHSASCWRSSDLPGSTLYHCAAGAAPRARAVRRTGEPQEPVAVRSQAHPDPGSSVASALACSCRAPQAAETCTLVHANELRVLATVPCTSASKRVRQQPWLSVCRSRRRLAGRRGFPTQKELAAP